MSRKINPCPLCGREAALFSGCYDGKLMYLVHCLNPDCGIHTDIYNNLDDLEKYWNKNTNIETSEVRDLAWCIKEIEALKECIHQVEILAMM